MTAPLENVLTTLRSKKEEYLEGLKACLRIPSISTLAENRKDMYHMADWLQEAMRQAGLENVAAMDTPGLPVIYGDWLHAPGKPTVLVYGHYDVQPVDPLDEWLSPPFGAEVRDDHIYARGASDMKGQIFAQLMAVEAWMAEGGCPVNLKYLIEGEEEIGSTHLDAFIQEHTDLLQCDIVLNCDAMIHSAARPSINYALRGLAYFELEICTAQKDMHSGMFGGAVHNPIHVLTDLLSGMHDSRGHITLPGFYDHVPLLEEEERTLLAEAPYDDADFLKTSGAFALHGEEGYTTLERLGARPSLDVNGIWGGFQGEGAKTVLPARAGAKLSMRLIPGQILEEVEKQLRAYIEQAIPEGCEWTVTCQSLGPGSVMNWKSPYMQAAVEAVSEVFGVKPFLRREGASVPVVRLLQERLGVDSIMLGFGQPDDGIHGPNEKQSLSVLFQGMESYARFMDRVGTIDPAQSHD
ncbi:MAG: dipeptidase [Candidatus Hydrogenedens sp.]|nr:dipeptidase [Candidatus Hydrogenedens sp.]